MWEWFRNLDIRKVAFAIGVLMLIEKGIVDGQAPLAGLGFPLWAVDRIKGVCAFFLWINGIILVAHPVSAVKWPTPENPKISNVAAIALMLCASLLGALLFLTPALAADVLPKKAAAQSPFLPASTGGPFISVGTSAGVANGSTSGTPLFANALVSGNLVADGADVNVSGGYIGRGGPINTWWRLKAGVGYQNISGGSAVGSIATRWRVYEEADLGANILQDVFAKVGNLGSLSSTFSALQSFVPALPSNVSVVGTPQQYLGFVLEESDLSGSFLSAMGQTWMIDYGVKTGWIWELPGADGKTPNGNALEVYAQVTWPNQGLTVNGLFASGGGPVNLGGSVKLGPMYRAGLDYSFGL